MKQKPTDYRNRIKALEYVDAADLTAHPGNWRDHPAAQAEALKGVLSEVGIAGALLAYRSERQGGALVVIDGHLRKDAAPQQWPVLILDVDDAEAAFLLATHDPLAAMATADAGALDALLSSVQSGEAAVQAMLASLAESAGIYPPKDDADAEPQIDRAEELREQWGVELGQMWRLPSRTEGQEHRIICGDCTIADVVERVMGGEKAHMIFTDPPYGVNYDGGMKKRQELEGDHIGTDIYADAIPVLAQAVDDSAPLYLWYADGHAAAAAAAAAAAGYQITAQIIWAKNHAQFVTSAHYKGKHEPCYYGHKRNKSARWHGPNNEVTLWEYDRSSSNEYHPTQKPIQLAQRAINNSSAVGDIVLDGFCGSASTIIAAENLSRQCRAVEISPAYVAVALQRYSDAFGITPELID